MKKARKIAIFALVFLLEVCSVASCEKTVETERSKDLVRSISVPVNALEVQASIADTYGDVDGIVTIISDDGFYDSCVNLNRIFSERNLRCTVAGAISIVEPHKEDWNKMLEDGTIDLVSHSYSHIRMEDGREIARDVDALAHEIVDADKWYEDWLGYEQIVFVCPENQMCKIGYEILNDNNFWSVRRGHRGYNSLSPEEGTEEGQWSNLMVQGICDDEVDLTVRNRWVDTAINDNTWLIEMWHNVMPEQDGGYQTILIPDAEDHMDYIAEKSKNNDVWVATYTDAVKYIREKQNSTIKAYIEDNELHVYVELTNSEMSYGTFNQPLTVLVELPDGYSLPKGSLVNVVPGEEYVIELIGE